MKRIGAQTTTNYGAAGPTLIANGIQTPAPTTFTGLATATINA